MRPAVARSSHASYLLSFTNTGQIACQLTGYPAVTVLSSGGQPVLRAMATPNGYLGGVRSKPGTVLIASGQPASALLEGELIDINGNRCPRRPGLAITPPDSTLPARIPVRHRDLRRGAGPSGGRRKHRQLRADRPAVARTSGVALPAGRRYR